MLISPDSERRSREPTFSFLVSRRESTVSNFLLLLF